MRHLNSKKRFNMSGSHRKAMFRNMATSLLDIERITTTLPRAKKLRSVAEKIITLGKKGTLATRRKAAGFVRDKSVVAKIFSELSDRYKDRAGGYTRIYKLGIRNGDAAPMAIIELVDRNEAHAPKKRRRIIKESDES
ncbi:MAG: 50S ribosomal protein L17 [Nitrospinota bacterium]